MAWLIFIELDKAVVHVIRLTTFLRLWFQCVCSVMPSRNTYHLTWVSLTLDMGYLFTAAPAKCRHCSLTLAEGHVLTVTPPDLERGVAPLGPPAPVQPPLLGLSILILLNVFCSESNSWSPEDRFLGAWGLEIFPVICSLERI